MLVTGVITTLLFLLSLVAMVEFPDAFIYIALGMVGVAVLFFLLRTMYRFRATFRVNDKKKPPKNG